MGDGATDDRAAIQAAIDAALASNATGQGSPCVLFPGGRYAVSSFNPGVTWARLALDAAHSGKIHLRGEGNATLSGIFLPGTDRDSMFAVFGQNYSDILIENLSFFRGVIAVGDRQVNAIAMAGWFLTGPQTSVLRPTIRNCTFENFPVAVQLSFCSGATVSGCRWRYDNGHLCVMNGEGKQPAVGIRCDGCADTSILDNYWVGTEGRVTTGGLGLCMDGFLWGESKGWIVRGNVVKRASTEGIYTLGIGGTGDPESYSLIEGNSVECDFPAALNPATMRSAIREGIRVDECNAVIVGNHLRKCRTGIEVNASSGGIVADNHIVFDAFDFSQPVGEATGSKIMGIVLQERSGVTIRGNKINFPVGSRGQKNDDPTCGITLAACADIQIDGNIITGSGTPLADLVAIFTSTASSGMSISRNTIKNVSDAVRQLHPPSDTQSVLGANTFIGVAAPRLQGWQTT